MIRKQVALPYNNMLLVANRVILKRIYLDAPLVASETQSLNPAAFHYVCRVLRCRDGEHLMLFNGDGNDYPATLHLNGKKSATVTVGDAKTNDRESPLHTILVQGLSKGERMDVAIQKAVELGVNEIYPVRTAYCAVKLSTDRLAKKQQHWQAIIISACEQCERAVLPMLHPVQDLSAVLTTINADNKWVLHPYATNTDSAYNNSVNRLAILVGPEGGLSETEVTMTIAQGFIIKTLGRRILRTETAAIAALALAQQQWGDWHV